MSAERDQLVGRLARQLVSAADVGCIARGGGWKDLHTRTTSPGYLGPDLGYSSVGAHIDVTRPLECRVHWSEIADIITAGLTEDAAAEVADAYRAYGDVACEPSSAWRDWQTDPAHAAVLEDHQARYREASRRLRDLTTAVVQRGIAAADGGQLSLFE